MSVGRYLSRERELRGIGLQEVAEQTKLARSSLEALEADAFDRLPGPVYVMGYLRAYAEVLGLDPEEVVLRYQEARGAGAEPSVPPRASGGRRLAPLLVLLGLVVLALAAWATLAPS